MVNSPSSLNVRPVAPPPLGGHVRHPIPLPYPAAHPVRGGDAPVPTVNQGKNPSNQGSSSLIKANAKFSMATRIPHPASSHRHPSPECPLCDSAPLRLCVKNPLSRHDQASIKAKTPAIKAYQALSRQTPKFSWPPLSGNQLPASLPGIPPCAFATPRLCVKNPASTHDQASIKAKTPAIKANRASSRQTSIFPCHPAFRPNSPTVFIRVHLRSPSPAFPKSENREPFPLPPIKANQTIPSPFACFAYFAVPSPRLPDPRNPGTVPDAPPPSSLIKADAQISMATPIRQSATGTPPRNAPFASATPRLCVKAQHPPAPVPT